MTAHSSKPPEPLLSVAGAEVRYGTSRAFSNCSFHILPGEMVSLIGPSGCGKTSLLYAIAGLLKPAGGTIQLQGGGNACSLMFQQDRLLPWKTLLDNVLLGLDSSRRDEAASLLETFGLGSHAGRYPHKLSGGERQRGALARSVIRRPRLLLLDEPFSSLDEQTRESLQDEIKGYIMKHHTAMFLVTHSISEAVFMGSRILVMTSDGILQQRENPCHSRENLRELDEFYRLEKILRSDLSGIPGRVQ